MMSDPKFKRPSKDEYYLGIAYAVARRSTCLKRQYGVVIVANDEIIATGYNGNPRGDDNCYELGTCLREKAEHNDSGLYYSDCRSVHAEQNALISAKRSDMIGATLYIIGMNKALSEPILDAEPCPICKRMIKNAGITRVVNARGDVECS